MHGLERIAQRVDWMADANCRGMNPAVFHPERGRSAGEIKAICEDCPVKIECLDMALADRSLLGIWGGTSERQRRKIRKQQAGVAA